MTRHGALSAFLNIESNTLYPKILIERLSEVWVVMSQQPSIPNLKYSRRMLNLFNNARYVRFIVLSLVQVTVNGGR
jgi:hypothetical protein